MTRRRRLPGALFTWANGLRVLGASGFLWLLIAKGGERPTYMLACLALMGVPTFWNPPGPRE